MLKLRRRLAAAFGYAAFATALFGLYALGGWIEHL